ncbi:MAG: ankyrin repeat domain-containing protein [Campylobacteraceae bacterium]|nr:ankyrin repeat domain-containing protein [Campylobacteraceae bacterium]
MNKYFFSLVFILSVFAGCASKNTGLPVEKDLHYAVRVNDMMLLNELISKEDINAKDEFGYTPLHIAARFNHFDIAKVLISKGADINTKDNYFDTPLIDSVKKGYTFMSELLICNGAKINAKDEKGVTVYEYARQLNDNRTAKLLSSKNIQQRCVGKIITPKKLTTTQFYNQISIDEYKVLTDNTPKICGDVHDEDVRRIQISFDSGESVVEANILGKRWCAQVEEKLLNGYYRVDAISVNSINEKGLTSEELEIKAINTLPALLKKEFENDLAKWNASFDEDSLVFRFNNPSLMFERGSNNLNKEYKNILSDFFPRYIAALAEYKNSIKNVYVEGHTSSAYSSATSEEEKFNKNLILSQERADAVLEYLKTSLDSTVIENETFIDNTFKAVGKSSKELILNADGSENAELSRRVEFKIEIK